MTWLRRTPLRILLGLAAVVGPVVALGYALDLPFLWNACLGSGLAIIGYVLFARWIEGRAVVELAPRALPEVGVGLALGAVLFALVIGSIWLAGGVEYLGWSPAPVLDYALGAAVMGGVVEELAVRGVIFRLLERVWGSWIALAISGLLFGALHLMNPGAGVLTALAIALEAGVMLGAAYLVTGRLWLPIGLHAGWNFTQGGIFGVSVSGNAVGGVMMTAPQGPEWISGGAFGAEASALAVLWCGALGVGLLVLAARRGRIVARGAAG